MNSLPESSTLRIKKRNRINKLTQKTHQISHEHGRATKELWRQIVTKAKKG